MTSELKDGCVVRFIAKSAVLARKVKIKKSETIF